MKQPQWITICAGLILLLAIVKFGRTVPNKTKVESTAHSEDDGHNHGAAGASGALSTDSILYISRKQLKPEQVQTVTALEQNLNSSTVKDRQLTAYHQLSHFWGDSIGLFPPYAWYAAEAARLENSEKTLTFAARLFLDNMQAEQDPALRQWEALQAKDLFERTLAINPANDSAKVGIGACYMFGQISPQPMEGILKIMEVVKKDSTNVYAQLMLVKGSLYSGQLDKAASRLELLTRLDPENIEVILMTAEVNERLGKKAIAADWYEKSLRFIKRADMRTDIEKRILELRK